MKLHSMRGNPVITRTTWVYNYGLMPNNPVKMFLNTVLVKEYSSLERPKENDIQFNQWLVGFTDGDGCFSIPKCGKYYQLQYSLSQSYYNIRILYYVKSKLGYGGVSKYEKNQIAHFRISDRKGLANVIFPIFDQFPLRTSKYYYYIKFKKAYEILENPSLNTEQKNNWIESLLNESLPVDYISPAINKLNPSISSYFDIDAAITDNWLTGFVEAEGCFSIYSDGGYFYIEFSLSQKLDIILLELIRRKLHIPGKIVKYSYINVLKTKNKRAINNIKDKFEGKMKGIKSLVFKLWLRAYYKTKSNSNYNKTFQNLCKINKLLTKTNFKLNNKNKFLISNLSNIVSNNNNVKLGNKSYHTSSNISNLNPFKQLSFRSFTSLSTQSIINGS